MVLPRLETTPLLSGERDWQAAVLRVVPVREECHAATRMYTSQILCATAHTLTITAQNINGLEYKYIHWRSVIKAELISLRILWFILIAFQQDNSQHGNLPVPRAQK